MKRLASIAALSVLCLLWVLPAAAQRRITPVNTAATATQSLNELKDDTAHINARRRARSSSYVNDAGMVVWVDTLTGDQWVDSMAPRAGIPKMQYGLLHSVSVGVDIWDAAMRLFGQDFGLVGFSAELNMHNRYIPVFEAGLGTASHRPSGMGYNYRSPMAPYFRIGANYNFLYNSNPSYMFVAGLRYGFSAFNWEVRDIDVESSYWDETAVASIPSQKATAGWLEICFGLRVKLAGPISAGWMLKYHSMLHCSSGTHGSPYYVPGYGARNGALTGAFYITYTLPFRQKPKDPAPETDIEK